MQETIRRIDQGKFGICGRCGGEIALRRLRLEPSSRLCTTCMATLERGINRHAA
jgi:RNA polymerase-binding transcription factor DksA